MYKRYLLAFALLLVTGLATACGGITDQPSSGEISATPAATVAQPVSEVATSDSTPGQPTQDTPTNPAATPSSEEVTDPVAALPVNVTALTITLEPYTSGLSSPIGIANAGDGSGRLFVLEKAGRVRIIQNGELLSTPFLDIRSRVNAESSERGLLGIAFHPGYSSNGYFFVNYSDRGGDTNVSRFQVTSDPNVADPDSEEIVLEVAQPAQNHNGGNLVFGPDGYLWIGLGDGGGRGDTYRNGQNTASLLGSMLRIDVDELPYSIPPDNPFVGDPAVRGEIWAYGLRNPWRYSFDRATGDLYIADVGQNIYEEVNVVPSDAAGLNYGWPIMEGLHCFSTSTCDQNGLIFPVAEYDHSQGCSITGGYVYRGTLFPQMEGVYLYGDYCTANIWATNSSGDGWQTSLVGNFAGVSLSSFGEGEDGELYLADMVGGVIYHVTAQS